MKWLFLALVTTASLQATDHVEEHFTEIYDKAVWGINEDGEGHSGGGSTQTNTVVYRKYLQKFLKDHNIKTVVDIGCGDWEFSKLLKWDGINYIGYDVVKSVIEKADSQHGSNHIHFVHANFLNEDLPEADLLICKDVLQHLNQDEIVRFLPQLKKYKHCLITNDYKPESFKNKGSHKRDAFINLKKPPFNIKGENVLKYKCIGYDKMVFHIENK